MSRTLFTASDACHAVQRCIVEIDHAGNVENIDVAVIVSVAADERFANYRQRRRHEDADHGDNGQDDNAFTHTSGLAIRKIIILVFSPSGQSRLFPGK